MQNIQPAGFESINESSSGYILNYILVIAPRIITHHFHIPFTVDFERQVKEGSGDGASLCMGL
jgi:hypothetical protein